MDEGEGLGSEVLVGVYGGLVQAFAYEEEEGGPLVGVLAFGGDASLGVGVG